MPFDPEVQMRALYRAGIDANAHPRNAETTLTMTDAARNPSLAVSSSQSKEIRQAPILWATAN
jgi:hypothetical protein